MRKQGFTLIELMIVIAIIAIIAAIAIPNLLSGRISANESSAVASLRLMTNAEATWLQQDVDANGLKDYWTDDVSCLHRALRADNTTKVAFIAIDLARADFSPGGTASNTYGAVANAVQIEDWTNIATTTKSGYLFIAMVDQFGGADYNQNDVDRSTGTTTLATNSSVYAFQSVPDVYATSGINSFIVNQEGTVYANDTGDNAKKWQTNASAGTTWPGANPAGVTGPNNRLWRVAD